MNKQSAILRASETEDTGIPRDWYFGEEWFKRDVEAIFLPRWQIAGHVDQLSEPGSYFTYAVGGVP